ncbi:DUF6795 domain-containing protein [Serratia sp. DD3]|uniref:DUF6795 domain-containing protein n=1 Tax=Serratia sp. DD3 TaxID=1410619 RepID=UPI0003C4F134|nr:carboxypeptidase-like regulatory domain-containing protein [Serratia sp. DD3]KEY56473.1 hypothetical protein SRDD_45180 [Serratia sp. DD3]KEY56693.1 hypothetical protein SRDD_42820 [Serratia sp. DD3]KEY58374.1 hypothetical protein SRDD_26200 [Serratia sp. DD3]KEY59404.1 hypothetical protein SRDD_16870 [Serratia sp. DD3]
MSVTTFRITSLAIFALPWLLSGCVYHDYPTPQIEGTLTNAGKPLAGVAVSLTEFDRQIATAQTDSNGHFSMAPKGNWHVFIPVGPQDRLSHWSLTTTDHQGQEISIYTSQRLGGVFSGYSRNDRVKLNCELSPAGEKSRSQESTLFCEPIPVNDP